MSAFTITRALLRASRSSRTHGAAFAHDVVRVCGASSHQAAQALRALVAAAPPKNTTTVTVHCMPRCVLQYEAIAFETVLVTEYVDHGDCVETFVREELVERAPTPPKLICFPTVYTIEIDDETIGETVNALLAQEDVDDVTYEAARSNAEEHQQHQVRSAAVGNTTPTTTTTANVANQHNTANNNRAARRAVAAHHHHDRHDGHEDHARRDDEDQTNEATIKLVVVLAHTPFFRGQYELYCVPIGARAILQFTKDVMQLLGETARSLWSRWF